MLGVVAKVGLEIGGAVIGSRSKAQEIQRIIGGRSTQDIWCIPGGVAKGVKPEELDEIRPMVADLLEFTQFSLQLFRDVVLANPTYLDIIANGPYTLDVHNMGLVDENDAPDFYDGQVRVVDFEGKELHRYGATDYADHVAEHVEPWTYLKFPYLRDMRAGRASRRARHPRVLRHAPGPAQRGRADGDTEGPGRARGDVRDHRRPPAPALLAQHWARLVEMVQTAEMLQRIVTTPRSSATSSGSSPARSPARASASWRPCAAR